jgi:hypothetical protein
MASRSNAHCSAAPATNMIGTVINSVSSGSICHDVASSNVR